MERHNRYLWGNAAIVSADHRGDLYSRTEYGVQADTLPAGDFLTATVLAFAVIPVVEVVKLFQRSRGTVVFASWGLSP